MTTSATRGDRQADRRARGGDRRAGQRVGEEGVDVRDPNLGGTVKFDWGWVKLVPAWHTSTTPKGTVNTPAGLLINFKDTVVYHLGDTCVFSDLQLVGKRHPIDMALMCIGGHYTMDRADAVDAAALVGAKTVIPCHYNTFPAIETDAEAFKSDVESATDSPSWCSSPGRRTRRDPRNRPDPSGALRPGHARRRAGRDRGRGRGVFGDRGLGLVAILRLREPSSWREAVTGETCPSSPGWRDPDDGGVRGLLAARSGGAVLGRAVSAPA